MRALPQADDDTRRNLLDAAGEIFAQHGFEHATVREICTRANANIAAINYHFGDKKSLYLQVIRDAKSYADRHYSSESLADASRSPEDRLADFIHLFCKCLLDRSRPSWHGRLMAREISDPEASGGSGLTLMVDEFIRPHSQLLESILAEFLFGKPPRKARLSLSQTRRIRMCVASVYGQCLHFQHGRSVMAKLYPDELPPSDQIDYISQGITEFTLGALAAIRDDARSNSRSTRQLAGSKARR